MPYKKQTPQWRIISELVGSENIIKHSKHIYEWEGLLFEVLGTEQVKNQKVLPTHYVPVISEGREWRIRQLGEDSKLYKEIKCKNLS
jgi:hypothetical protein